LANAPAVILADEPTGNLDPDIADQIFTLMLKVAKNQGLAVLMATHNMVLAEQCHQRYRVNNHSLEKIA
jgi:lipoprotein-releasing system ATP-binding protein